VGGDVNDERDDVAAVEELAATALEAWRAGAGGGHVHRCCGGTQARETLD
jgi:uncharacterized protein (DUF849 family)